VRSAGTGATDNAKNPGDVTDLPIGNFWGDERDGVGPTTPRPGGVPVFISPNCDECGSPLVQRTDSGFLDEFDCPTPSCQFDTDGNRFVIMDWPTGPQLTAGTEPSSA
jgi:hypothetical protein